MQFVNNGPEEIEIRRSRDTLIVVGSGTVLFSIWSAARMLGMLFLLRKETVTALLEKTGTFEEIPEGMAFWAIFVVVMVIMAVILGFRMYVGLSAIAEGRGKRRSLLYILIAAFMIISTTWYLCTGFITAEAPEQLGALTRNQSISTFIIDATSMIMLIQMIVSALRIRKLTGAEVKAKG